MLPHVKKKIMKFLNLVKLKTLGSIKFCGVFVECKCMQDKVNVSLNLSFFLCKSVVGKENSILPPASLICVQVVRSLNFCAQMHFCKSPRKDDLINLSVFIDPTFPLFVMTIVLVLDTTAKMQTKGYALSAKMQSKADIH